MVMFKKLSLLTASLLISSLPINQAEAITFVPNRASLVANDQIDWRSKFTTPPFSIVGYNFTATSQNNLGVNVTVPFIPPSTGIIPPFVFQTGAMVPTNFANGDFILFSGLKPGSGVPALGNPGPITITFSRPVTAVGTQIATDDALAPYTATLEAYDSGHMLLGSFTIPATSSIALDNSAVFLGVESDLSNIASIRLFSSLPTQAIGINRVSLTVVPEPSTTLGMIIVLGLGASLNRKSADRKNV